MSAVLIGWEVLEILAVMYCPDGEREGAVCYARSWLPVQDAVIAIFSALSALLAVSFSVLVAPSHKVKVATCVYIVGASIAVWLGITAKSNLLPVLATLAAGFLTVLFTKMAVKQTTSNESRMRGSS